MGEPHESDLTTPHPLFDGPGRYLLVLTLVANPKSSCMPFKDCITQVDPANCKLDVQPPERYNTCAPLVSGWSQGW